MSTTDAAPEHDRRRPAGLDHEPSPDAAPLAPTASEAERRAYQREAARLPRTLGELFAWRVAQTPDHEAYRSRDGQGGWTAVSWQQAAEVVDEVAAGLLDLGLGAGDAMAIASATRVEWIYADLAVLRVGAATTTVYPSAVPQDVELILADSAAVAVFVEDAAQLAKVRDHWITLERLRAVIVLDEAAVGPSSDYAGDPRVMSWRALRDRGRALLARQPDIVARASAAVRPDQLATLLYTSGTTGRPKGARLTHRAWLYEAAAVSALGLLTEDDLQYLWLPLSHAFGKVLLSVQLAVGFRSAVDGDVDRIADGLVQVRPTFMAGTPRVFEAMHARARTGVPGQHRIRARLLAWGLRTGAQVAARRRQGARRSVGLLVRYALADRLVLAGQRARFGGRLRYFVSGSAALSSDVAQWLHSLGVLVLEGYGLTETAAASFLNRPDAFAFGSVGRPLPGTAVRLGADGEVQLRSPGLMTGYHGRPADTEAAFTTDGWLRTGDLGSYQGGFLRITDRQRDLITTADGRSLAPQSLETKLKALCPYLSQVVVHGSGRPWMTALVALDPDAIVTWAQRHGLAGAPYEQIVTAPQAHSLVQEYVDELNAGLAGWQRVRRFAVLPVDLCVEAGDLTPSLTLRRRAVERRYGQLLDSLYPDRTTGQDVVH